MKIKVTDDNRASTPTKSGDTAGVSCDMTDTLHTQLRIYAFKNNQSVQKIDWSVQKVTGKIISDWAAGLRS